MSGWGGVFLSPVFIPTFVKPLCCCFGSSLLCLCGVYYFLLPNPLVLALVLRLIPRFSCPSRNDFLRYRYSPLDIDKTEVLPSFYLAVRWRRIGRAGEYALLSLSLWGISLGRVVHELILGQVRRQFISGLWFSFFRFFLGLVLFWSWFVGVLVFVLLISSIFLVLGKVCVRACLAQRA